jgi:NAD(P)-dependent dehydrogenase (short-subunit alcohol dehydrogenase family)
MKTCLVTGGNAGIGKAAAIQIAEKGFRVLIGCRNEERGKKALEDIRSFSGNPEVYLVVVDLSSLASIRAAAKEITDQYGSLDVLIHNAADFDISRKKPITSEDGIETIWATNHIGPVLLTQLLLDLLRSSEQGRILTVASKGLVVHPKLKIDLTDPEFKSRKFSVPKAYYQSKLAQVMYTYWLAEKLKDSGITVNCIRVTNVKIDLNRYPDLSKIARFAYAVKSRSSLSPEEMARTYTWLATDMSLTGKTGQYYNEKNSIVNSSSYSRQPEKQEKLMDVTMKYIK